MSSDSEFTTVIVPYLSGSEVRGMVYSEIKRRGKDPEREIICNTSMEAAVEIARGYLFAVNAIAEVSE